MRGRGGLVVAVLGVALAFALAPAAAGVPTPPVPVGVVYAGEINQQFGLVSIEVTPARNRVARLNFTWSADCAPGPAAQPTTPKFTSWTEYTTDYPINARGRFGDTFVLKRLRNGIQQEFTYKVGGLRSSTKVTGTLQVTLVEKTLAGELIRTCPSPVLRYAAAQRSFYAGLTRGQKRIALIRLNRAGTAIQRIRWDWTGTCRIGPGARPETETTQYETDFVSSTIPLRSTGAFASNLSYDPNPSATTGLTRTYRARVTGRKVGSTLRGTLTAGFLETNTATGAVVRDCASGPVRFIVKD